MDDNEKQYKDKTPDKEKESVDDIDFPIVDVPRQRFPVADKELDNELSIGETRQGKGILGRGEKDIPSIGEIAARKVSTRENNEKIRNETTEYNDESDDAENFDTNTDKERENYDKTLIGDGEEEDNSLIIECWGCKNSYDINDGATNLTKKGMVVSHCPSCNRARIVSKLEKAPKSIRKRLEDEKFKSEEEGIEEDNRTDNRSIEDYVKEITREVEPQIEPESKGFPNQRGGLGLPKDAITFTEDELKALDNAKTLKQEFYNVKKKLQETNHTEDEKSPNQQVQSRVKTILSDLGLKDIMDEMIAMQALEAYGSMTSGFFNKYKKGEKGNQGGSGMDIEEIAKLMVMKNILKEDRPQPQGDNSITQFMLLQSMLNRGKENSSDISPLLLELVKGRQNNDPTPLLLEVVKLVKSDGNGKSQDDIIKLITTLQSLLPKEKPDNTDNFLKMLAAFQQLNPKKEENITDVVKLIATLREPKEPKQDFDDFLKLFAAIQTMNSKQQQQPAPDVNSLITSVAKIFEVNKPQQGPDHLTAALLKMLEDRNQDRGRDETQIMMQLFDKIQEKDAEVRRIHDQMLYEKLGELAEAARGGGGDFEDEFKKVFTNWALTRLSDSGSANVGGMGAEISNMLNGPFGKVLGKVAEAALQNKQSTGTFDVPPSQLQDIQQQVAGQFQQPNQYNAQWYDGSQLQQQEPMDIPPEYAHLFQQEQPQPQPVSRQTNRPNEPRIIRSNSPDSSPTIIPGSQNDAAIVEDGGKRVGGSSEASPANKKFWRV